MPTLQINCDISPLKLELKRELQLISEEIERSLLTLENDNDCMLARLENIRDHFTQIELTAAAFYLNCYLTPHTDKYEVLSDSLRHLSTRRHGALIVIQRHDPLEQLIHPGTPIGALLTQSLLESIFYPGSPLHDGAVLVQGNTIISAGNVLPLSRTMLNGTLTLGTRHRAAVGLSERSDALVLVVSEETGRVSFAMGGTLYPVTTGVKK